MRRRRNWIGGADTSFTFSAATRAETSSRGTIEYWVGTHEELLTGCAQRRKLMEECGLVTSIPGHLLPAISGNSSDLAVVSHSSYEHVR